MSKAPQLSVRDRKDIAFLVDHFGEQRHLFESLLNQIVESIRADLSLGKYVHSLKWRVKDSDHLRKKLERKCLAAKREKRSLGITTENLFDKINDLAGCRILHLYTKQFKSLHESLTRVFDEYKYEVIEGPTARTWDDESRAVFSEMGIRCKESPSLYTSVHYVIAPNTRTRITCEIQVRTLAEELWGEVDHAINYPEKSDSLACREQIKVLARLTSGCTRLVDSIFSSHQEYHARLEKQTKNLARTMPQSKP